MRYLVASDYCFVDRPGGSARVAWDIACAMRDRGHEVTTVTLDQRPERGQPMDSVHDGIRVVRYDLPAIPSWHPNRYEKRIGIIADFVRTSLGDIDWDVVHFHSPMTGVGTLRGLGRGPRYVDTVHSPIVLEQQINWADKGLSGKLKLWFGQGTLRKIEKELLDSADAIHTLSQFTRDQLEKYHGVGERVTVIPHWRRPELKRRMSREEARRKLGWPVDETIFFSVRRLGPRYGIDLAIRALAQVDEGRPWRYYIGGAGSSRAAFEQLTHDLGIADRVTFLGRISDEDLDLAYQAADLFFLPTLSLECFGLITLEALSYGCPVLSSDAAAIPETMRPILPEFVTPAGDVGVLAEKIGAFLGGRLRAPSEEAMVGYVRENFDSEVVLPRMFALLEGAG